MGYAALKIPQETKDKYRKVGDSYPRVPLSQVADAVVDGWLKFLTPEQRDACIGIGQKPRRFRRREKVTA